jgi:EmrB/QacA subfamily drug resistance transporter
MLVIFLYAIDATVVSTAMPTVVGRLGDIELYSWVFTVYMLTSALATPLFGKLSDLFGRRRLILIGIAIFVAGSLLCGASQSMVQLIVFRAIQGVGGGAIYALSFIIVGVVFPAERQAKVHGLISGVWGLSSLLGPLGGGIITQYWNWRWIFFINLPVAIVATILIFLGFHESDAARRRPRLDLKGAVSLLLGLIFLFYALSPGGRAGHGPTPVSLLLFATAIATLVVFFLIERSVQEPIIPLDLFRSRLFTMASLLTSLAALGVFGVISYMPLYVQGVLGGSATQAGTVLLLASLGWTLGSVTAGQGLNRLGYRMLSATGMGLMTMGYGLFVVIGPRGGMIGAMAQGVMVCVGMGMVSVTALVASQNAVPVRRIGVATSTIMLFRTFGGAFGVSVMGSVLFARMYRHMVELSADAGVNFSSAEIMKFANPQNLMEPATRLLIPERLLPLLIDALGQSIWYAFLAGFFAMLLGLCLSPLMERSTPASTSRPPTPTKPAIDPQDSLARN